MNYQTDIPLSLAIAAHAGTSFSPDKRGVSEVSAYAQQLQTDYLTLERHAKAGNTEHLLADEFERFRSGCRARTLAHLRSRSHCMSTMIAGPANFPIRRNAKRFEVSNRRMTEMLEGRERALRAAIRNLRPDLRPIMAGDADAIERLQAELVQLKGKQEWMKRVNQIIRKKQAHLLVEELGMSDEQAQAIMNPARFGCVGYPRYKLTNNGANIRRVEARVEQLQRAKAMPVTEVESEDGIRIEDNPPDNRVRLYFPDKPSSDVRETLKQSGFRWAPTIGAWQAYRNHRTLELARSFVTTTTA